MSGPVDERFWRKRAYGARRIAKSAKRFALKRELLLIAEAYAKLAKLASERSPGSKPSRRRIGSV